MIIYQLRDNHTHFDRFNVMATILLPSNLLIAYKKFYNVQTTHISFCYHLKCDKNTGAIIENSLHQFFTNLTLPALLTGTYQNLRPI